MGEGGGGGKGREVIDPAQGGGLLLIFMSPQCRAVAGSDTRSEILHFRVTGSLSASKAFWTPESVILQGSLEPRI